MTEADLVAAATREVDARAKHYPMDVANGLRSASDATIDWQAWTCIAGFIASGRFESIPSGGHDGKTFVGWQHAQAAVDKAVAGLAAEVDAALKAGADAKALRLGNRLAGLQLIARRVTRQHQLINSINQALRDRAAQPSAVAA